MLLQPPAKINIGLYITGKREDGYHNLETVFYPVPLQDTLELKPLTFSSKDYDFETSGFPIAGNPEDNLVIKVYQSLKSEFGFAPLDIYLDKKIPMGAGLGGGSSDAATMMLALNDYYQLGLSTEEMEKRMAAFGADCAFFIKARPAFATGIGDQLTSMEVNLKGWFLALVKPQESVSTQEAYAQVVPQPAPIDLRAALQRPVSEWKDCVKNDFENSVFDAHPKISAIKETLYDMGAAYASMSGSGSTVFGLFKHRPDNLKRIFTDCFCYQSMIRQ